jgi:non-lysosomal glucosylceramidase
VAIRIPDVAWERSIGLGYDPAPRPRVETPMIDDGPWAGVPIGGIGSGSIGRTQRGDFARRHLRIGDHRFGAAAVDGFALWVRDGERSNATVLRTTPPPSGWGPGLAVGAGTYRALFPRAWLNYDLGDLPVRVTEEQLSPVLPGDDASASLPVGAFEYELENTAGRPIDVSVLLAWQDDLGEVLGATAPGAARTFTGGPAAGVAFEHPVDGTELGGSFAIATGTGDGIDVTTMPSFDPEDAGSLWSRFATTGRVGPAADTDPAMFPAKRGAGGMAGAVAARVTLAPGERRSLRFAIAWDLPVVEFGGGRRWRKRYTREWGTNGDGAPELAARAIDCLPVWRDAIEAWQAPILAAANRPDWYKAALFNELYFLVDGASFWPDGPVVPESAALVAAELALLECIDYPFYDTLDVHFYAAFAISALWPRLEASISRAYAATVEIDDPALIRIEASGEMAIRKVAGALPHDLGGPREDPLVRVNHYAFQEVNSWKDLNPKFVLQAWRDRLFADDEASYLREVWPAVRRAMAHVAAFDRDGDGLPEHDGRPDQTYDTWPMTGPSAYGGSLWLAALRAAAALARAVGEEDCAAAWDADSIRGAASFGSRLWNGRSFDYDASGGPTSDSVMADQLVGQWYADVCGLGDLVPPEQVRSSLERIFELNVEDFGDGLIGAVNGMRPDGTVDRSSEQSQEVWVGTTYALAAFMIGRGMVDEGWTTAEGAARVTYERGLWFRTPEAYDRNGNFRASLYLRPLAIWAIEEALERAASAR